MENLIKALQIMLKHGDSNRITDSNESKDVITDSIDILEIIPDFLKPKELNNLTVKVELSKDKQTYLATITDLGIEVAAYTRLDLVYSLEAEIGFLWKNIAKEDAERLSPKAIKLKEKLKELFVQV